MLTENTTIDGPPLVVDFLNSLDVRTFGNHPRQIRDEIGSPQGLVHWASLRGVRLDGVSKRDVAKATAARDALRACLDGDCTQADRLARTVPLACNFRGGVPALRPASKGVDSLLGSILVAVVSLKIRGHWQRVKLCAAPDCRWVFYDTAKNRLRRWCSTGGCGNRAKTRKYRTTHRAESARA